MNYAVIENNKVVNVIVADNKEIAEEITGLICIDVTNGWDYSNGIDGDVFFPSPTVENPTE